MIRTDSQPGGNVLFSADIQDKRLIFYGDSLHQLADNNIIYIISVIMLSQTLDLG